MNKSLFAKPICVQRLARSPQKGLSPLCVKQFITFLIALAAMTVSTTSAWAQTASIKYLDYDQYPYYKTFSEASHDDPTKITSSSISLSGWYYVEGNVTISSTVTLSGDTHLILCDGAELKINVSGNDNGISSTPNLTIYAQSSGSHAGKLTINSDSYGIYTNGNVTINGGIISVTSSSGEGIYCFRNFTVNGGTVTAFASANDGVGIHAVGVVTINGGTVSATGGYYGISATNGNTVTIKGGKFLASGGFGGFASDGVIKLGWTNAEDYIEVSSYHTIGSIINTLKDFYIDGSTPLAAANNVSSNSIAGKKLTPKTDDPSYTIAIGSGITGGTVEVDKTKAFVGKRVAINVTPDDGKILASLTYNDGTKTYTIGTNSTDIKRQANDYVITMPAANVTVNATFVTPVAQIGDTKYPTLQAAFDAVPDGGATTIDILREITEATTARGNWDNPNITLNLNGNDVTIGGMTNLANLSIYGNGGTMTVKNSFGISNANSDNTDQLLVDKATIIIEDGIQWMAEKIKLQNNAKVTIYNNFYLGYSTEELSVNIDNGSWMKLISCAIGATNGDQAKAALLPLVCPDLREAFTVPGTYGTASEPYYLRGSWGIELKNGLSNATTTFYDGGTSFDPTAFSPSAYTTSTLYVDNSDDQDHYVIAHIVPELSYWTDLSLLSAVETGTSLTGDANALTLLKRDQYDAAISGDPDMRDRYDGAGWYYYTLPKGHSVAAGYATSTIGGEVVPQFDLGHRQTVFTYDLDNNVNTLTISRPNIDTWTATLTYDKLTWKFGGSFALSDLPKLQSISFKKGDTEMFSQSDADALAGQIENAYEIEQVRIGENPLKLRAIIYGCFVQSDYFLSKYKVLVPFDGDGSTANPWQINTAADLSLLAKCVNVGAYTFNGETLAMGNNETYDMSGSDFEPIGTDSNLPFCGTLLGNGSTIKNISYVFAGPSAVSDETQYGIGFIGNLGEIGEPRRSGNVDNIKLENCSFSSSDNDICYVGSLAGAANRGSVSNCYVIGGNVSAPKPGSYAGAIVGKLGAATLKYNYYDYTTTATLGSSTASGYTKRGICTETISVDPGTPSTYDWNDFPTNDGAMLWVKKASIIGGTSANGSTVAFNKVTKGTDRYDMAGDDFYYAVGQTVTLDVNLGNRTDDIRTFCDELSALTVSDGTTNTDIKGALNFTMPGADATVTATIAESDWFTINTVNYNAADPTAPFAYNWMTFYHEWTMKDPTSGNNVAGKFVVTNYDDPTAAVEVKTITAVDPTAGTYTSAAINGSYSGVPTLFHYADNNNGVLPQKLKFTPDFNIEQNQTADRRFKGTATALALSASAKCYILNNAGDFILAYITLTDNTIAAHRCYVDLSGDNSNQARLISSGDATGIDSMVNGQGTMDNLDGDWFSLDGRRLNGQPTRKGIYIHHGKKTVIK